MLSANLCSGGWIISYCHHIQGDIMAAFLLTFSLPDLVSNPPHSQPYNSCDIFGIGSTYNLLIDILLSSYHLSAWYCFGIVTRNSDLITHEN